MNTYTLSIICSYPGSDNKEQKTYPYVTINATSYEDALSNCIELIEAFREQYPKAEIVEISLRYIGPAFTIPDYANE